LSAYSEFAKRTKYDIFAELIRVIGIIGKCPLTRAARTTNLPVDRAKVTLEFLVEKSLLKKEQERNRTYYMVTVKGQQYLQIYNRLIHILGMPPKSMHSIF